MNIEDIIEHRIAVGDNICKSFKNDLFQAKKETDINPSEAEKNVGNYKKGHIKFGGYEMVIENPKGSFRKGKDKNGKEWSIKMNNTYGYFLGTLGKDKDHIDVFINDKKNLEKFSGNIYVIDQVDKDGNFDEHKIMYGFDSKEDAKNAYLSNYEKNWKGLGTINECNKKIFDKWISQSKRKIKPFKEYLKTNLINKV